MEMLIKITAGVLLFTALPLQAEPSEELENKVTLLLEGCRDITVIRNPLYPRLEGWRWKLEDDSLNHQGYHQLLSEIAELAKAQEASDLILLSPLKLEIVKLAMQVSEPDFLQRTEEIRGWYGSYDYDVPDALFEKKWGNSGLLRMSGKTLQEFKEGMKEDDQITVHGRSRVEKLHEEHATAEYLLAWKYWLIAPPSQERDFMRGRTNQALEKIGDESVIPLLVETLKVEVKRWRAKKASFSIQQQTALAFINLICSMPGEKALGGLLECNRYAIEAGLNGDDYYESITRHIIRRLASRRAYADQLIDPKMKETIERQGYNEKPEDIPLTDQLWKQYKPLIEARLESKTENTPAADIELLESALKIMP